MVSKKLMGVWAFLDFCLLTAGVVSIALSFVWRAPNPTINLVLDNADLTGSPTLLILIHFTADNVFQSRSDSWGRLTNHILHIYRCNCPTKPCHYRSCYPELGSCARCSRYPHHRYFRLVLHPYGKEQLP